MSENPSSEAKRITLPISYTAADFTEAVRIYKRTTSMHSINRVVSIVGLLVVGWGLVLMALDFFLLPNLFGEEFRLGLFETHNRYLRWIILALIPLSALSWRRSYRPLAVWSDFQLNKTKYQGSYQVTIDPQGVLVKTSTAESRQYWSAFSKVLGNERLFILVYGPWQYAVLPKREFVNPESIEEFKGYLQEQIGTYSTV
jgi:hypothetical protein